MKSIMKSNISAVLKKFMQRIFCLVSHSHIRVGTFLSFVAIISSLVLLFSSCKGFLEENLKDGVPESEVYDDLNELYIHSVASLYNNIGGYNDSYGLQGTGRGVYDLNTFTTDEAIMPTRGTDWYDGGFWQGLYLHDWGTNNSAILSTWEYLYSSVMLCNESLQRIESFDAHNANSSGDTSRIASFKAEVRALRALFYYHLMDLFGRIPLVLQSGQLLVQEERSDVFKFIVSELQDSAPLLLDCRSNFHGEYYGRITRPVVYFLLAKLMLNAEVYMDDDWTDSTRPDGKTLMFTADDSSHRMNAWEATVYYCDKIAESGCGYGLESDYTANFSVFNESSVENIFVIPMDKTLYSNQFIYLFRSRHYNHAKAYGLGGENGACATVEVLRTFGYGTDQEDPRFDFCYFDDELTDLNGNPILLDDGKTVLKYDPWNVQLDVSGKIYEKTAGARMKKYEVETTAFKDGKLIDNDIVLFRYADVLLMKSEAKVRNGENGDNELNLVRSRVNAPARPATLQTLLDERLLELAWEGWRRQDLIRFGRYTMEYSNRKQLPDEASGYTTVFPIPDKIIQMNEGFTQNPGYPVTL